jgi:hypothetical protein
VNKQRLALPRGGIPIAVSKLESIARSEGLLRPDEALGQSSTFRRAADKLGIESRRVGFGAGAHYIWRLRPPEWTGAEWGRGLGVHG